MHRQRSSVNSSVDKKRLQMLQFYSQIRLEYPVPKFVPIRPLASALISVESYGNTYSHSFQSTLV